METGDLLQNSPQVIPAATSTTEPPPTTDPEPTNPPASTGPISSGASTVGVLDSVANGVARGWACDPDYPTKSIKVALTIGGPAGSAVKSHMVTASQPSGSQINALCNGATAHRFKFTIPNWQQFKGLLVYAYGIDATGDNNSLLVTAPQSL